MSEPDYYFWLGDEAEQAACDMESYEQLLREAEVFDLTEEQAFLE